MTMYYRSTRSAFPEVSIRRAALEGLAPDAGLYLPKEWPAFSENELAAMRGASYQEIAFRVLFPFLSDVILADDLRKIIANAHAPFADPAVTPLRTLGDLKILELFHGPTLAFKDVALQFVGQMFEYFLQGASKHKTIIGATSGDTGSAAIEALANRKGIDVFILYPEKGPSEVQRRQMTCVDAPNIHAIAVQGTFDDCQRIVKALFADPALREKWNHTTVNSINLLRILAQIVYYFVAALQVQGKPSFVVPTGNFGDVFAGYAAMRCGLPVEKLVVASNSNNILTRFFASGRMEPQTVKNTLSPSMDIQISSNFERLLFDMCDGDTAQVRELMNDLRTKRTFSVSADRLQKARETFAAGFATDDETLATIKGVFEQYAYVLDPHTAVGVKVAADLRPSLPGEIICLATAHPAKFPDTICRALGFCPPVPERIAALISKPERTTLLPADTARVAAFIEERKKA